MPSIRPLTISLAFGLALLAGHAQTPAQPAADEPLSEAQATQFKELDADFDRLQKFLSSLPDSQPRNETQRVLDFMKKRADEMRSARTFDQGRFDEIRFETNFEYQQMQLWLLEPRVKPLPRDGSVGPLRPLNGLTPQEKASGWELLFDGRSFAGWRGYKLKGPPPAGWEIKDGLLRTSGGAATGVDLITERKFANFELMWEWRLAPGANSGIKYFVTEDRPNAPGHEYQLLDDTGDPSRDRRTPAQRTGAFYDVLEPAVDKPLKAAGQWNQSRLVVKGSRVEHWLNGRNVLTYEVGGPAVKAGIAKSKFKDERAFGQKVEGHLLITYHASEASFRNLKVRELK
jgi:hypothetical protein